MNQTLFEDAVNLGNHLHDATILAYWNTTLAVSPFRVDNATDWDSLVLIFPATNSTGGYAYGGTGYQALVNSIGNRTIGVSILSNCYAPLVTFDVSIFVTAIFGCFTGFYYIGTPLYISGILVGIFGVLLAFGIAKLIIG